MKRLFLIIISFFIYSTHAQYTDHFLDGEFTSNPTWSGTNNLIIVNNSHALQPIYSMDSNIAYLSTNSLAINNAIWQCSITISSDTETAIRFYLTSNQPALNQPLLGYFIQVGGIPLSIRLYCQSYSECTLLTESFIPNDASGQLIKLICIRSDAGDWQLYYQTANQTFPQSAGTVHHALYTSSKYSGILFQYTPSTYSNLTADDFVVTGDAGTSQESDINTRHSIIFSELMIDPTPAISLPEEEYLEIYNRTDSTISLSNWELISGKTKSTILQGEILPHSYAIICAASNKELFIPYGNIITLSSFPPLTNTGKLIYLTNSHQEIITWIEYSDKWFLSDDFKNEGGYAIERIDCDNLNVNRENWMYSKDHKGGTPGAPNSINNLFPDTISPFICFYSIDSLSTLKLFFNKELNPTSLYLQTPNTTIKKQQLLEPQHNTLEISFHEPISSQYPTLLLLQNTTCISGLSIPDTTLTLYMPQLPLNKDIIINEILYDISDNGVRFIELYNRSQKELSIRNLKLTKYDTKHELESPITLTTEPIVIHPKKYLLLSPNLHGLYELKECKLYGVHLETNLPTLNQKTGNIVITNTQEDIIDYMEYDESLHHPLLTSTEDVSLERINPNISSLQKDNWTSASSICNYATPGYRNSQFLDENRDETQNYFSLSLKSFTPNNDGYEDHIMFHYQLPSSGYMLTIKIYTPNAVLVSTLCNNLLIGTEGNIIWDGTDNNQNSCPVGIYILWVQASHPQQKTIIKKLICVITAT